MIKFIIPGQPQGKARARVTVRGNRAFAYTPDKTAAYESLIKFCCSQVANNLIETPVKITISAHYKVPKSFTKARALGALIGTILPQTKPDLDNVIKIICDALNELAYRDDNQIVQICASKHYAIEPKVVVEIEEVLT